MYGAEPDAVDMEHLSNAYDLINDDEAEPRMRAIVDALPRVPQVKSMLVTSVEKLIEAIQAKSPAMTTWPEVKSLQIAGYKPQMPTGHQQPLIKM